VEFSEENALTRDFICEECGNVFTLKDNSKVLKELKSDEKFVLCVVILASACYFCRRNEFKFDYVCLGYLGVKKLSSPRFQNITSFY